MEIRALLQALGDGSAPRDVAVLLDHPDAEEGHVLALLRRRALPAPIIETIARHDRWGRRHTIRAAIVNHPKTPKTLALRMMNLLFWRELLRVCGNVRLAMPVRIAAEARLRERLPELELGERIALARTAPPGLIPLLAQENEPRVIRALLTNPRLRELEVLRLADGADRHPEVLRVVAESERWAARLPVRVALVRNGRTPVHAALRLLATLPPRTVRDLLARSELPPVVARGAERLLAGERLGRSTAR